MFLDCRANEVVCDSSGKPRADTGGGATQRLFMQLPGVGAKTAKIWYDLGYRWVVSGPIAPLSEKTWDKRKRRRCLCSGVAYGECLLTSSLTKGELGNLMFVLMMLCAAYFESWHP
jgi:hypothetical protein